MIGLLLWAVVLLVAWAVVRVGSVGVVAKPVPAVPVHAGEGEIDGGICVPPDPPRLRPAGKPVPSRAIMPTPRCRQPSCRWRALR